MDIDNILLPMLRKFFTNRDGNTLIKQFEGLLQYNPDIANSQGSYPHLYKRFFIRYKVFKCIVSPYISRVGM